MAESKTLYLDLVPATQESITAAIEKLEGVGLAAAGAARHVVEPFIEAARSTRDYLAVDHTQVVDATVGYAGKLAEQQRAFLSEFGDVLLGKSGHKHATKPRSSNSSSAAA